MPKPRINKGLIVSIIVVLLLAGLVAAHLLTGGPRPH
jgi:hypothetical protein